MARNGIVALLAIVRLAIAQGADYAQFVNPFIGSEGAIPGYACKDSNFANRL